MEIAALQLNLNCNAVEDVYIATQTNIIMKLSTDVEVKRMRRKAMERKMIGKKMIRKIINDYIIPCIYFKLCCNFILQTVC